jgi:polysaccharide export outer membrane protein
MTNKLASGQRLPSETGGSGEKVKALRLILLTLFVLPATIFAQSATPAESIRRAAPASSVAGSLAPPSDAVSAPTGYTLRTNDQVAIEVFGEEDLRTNGRLNGEGNLSLPLLGSVHLGGLTLAQAASKITELYGRDYLVNPRVNVSLVGYAKRRFTILGQVSRPGSYELPEGSPDGVDLLEAIAMAGGYTRIAAPERISVRRRSASGEDEILRVDAKRLAKRGGENFQVRPGDTVTVAESLF